MKRTIAVLLAALMALSLAACGGPAAPVAEGETAQVANPWREITAEEATSLCARLFSAPEGAESVRWSAMDSDKEGVGPLVQLDFNLAGQDFTARAQQGAAEGDDISGLHIEWGAPEIVTLDNWGDGNMQATVRRGKDGDKNVVLCSWFDTEIGICYTLATSHEAMPAGFNILPNASAMYDPANEPNIP